MKPGVLVTGAYGFVGAQLCGALLKRGWRVLAGHRRTEAPVAPTGMTSVYLPLSTAEDRWLLALQSVECVVHLAAHVHQMTPGPGGDAAYEQINLDGTRRVAEQAARAGVKRFVFLSSAKVNGEGDDSRIYRAEDAAEPHDAYARSKAAAENVIREICERSAMQFIIVRPPLVYGPGVRANFERLMRLAERGLPLPFASIANRRSMVGVANLVDFIGVALEHPGALNRVWLITDGEVLSTPELIRRLAGCMHRPARLFRCPPALLKAAASCLGRRAEASRLCDSFVLDSSPAGAILGWNPPMTVEEGLVLTVADYLARKRS